MGSDLLGTVILGALFVELMGERDQSPHLLLVGFLWENETEATTLSSWIDVDHHVLSESGYWYVRSLHEFTSIRYSVVGVWLVGTIALRIAFAEDLSTHGSGFQ